MKHWWLDAGSGGGYGSGFTAMTVIDPQADEQEDAERPDPDEPAVLPVNRSDDPE